LADAFDRESLRILGDCLMPKHWHRVVWPDPGADRQVSEFMRRLTVPHTQRWQAHRHTSGTGHLYQG
jgi:putative transposase